MPIGRFCLCTYPILYFSDRNSFRYLDIGIGIDVLRLYNVMLDVTAVFTSHHKLKNFVIMLPHLPACSAPLEQSFKNWFHCKTYFTGFPYLATLSEIWQYVFLPSSISQQNAPSCCLEQIQHYMGKKLGNISKCCVLTMLLL